jgi:hypothetical protein
MTVLLFCVIMKLLSHDAHFHILINLILPVLLEYSLQPCLIHSKQMHMQQLIQLDQIFDVAKLDIQTLDKEQNLIYLISNT